MELSKNKKPGLVRKYSYENGRKFIGWGSPVKQQATGFYRRLGQTKLKLIDLVSELRKYDSEVFIFGDSDDSPRSPTEFELMGNVKIKGRVFVECENGHLTSRLVQHAISGKRCRVCLNVNKSKFHLDDLRLIAYKNGGKCLSTKFETTQDKYEFECSEGHRWVTEGKAVIHRGCWCPKCAARIKGEARQGPRLK